MDNSKSFTDQIEELLIASILGVMTLVTFANVVARYGFNKNILWALELTVFLFGWLVLLGATYAVKKSAHLGVDIIINILNTKKNYINEMTFVKFIRLFFKAILTSACCVMSIVSLHTLKNSPHL